MDELERADIVQQYRYNVIVFEGVHCQVRSVNEDSTVNLITVAEGAPINRVPFSLSTFKPPSFRLGMSTLEGSTAYLTRIPVRKMGIGLSVENINIAVVGNTSLYFSQTIGRFVGEFIVDTFLGKYPNISLALSRAKEHRGVVAFDRQMAVDYNNYVYYKTQKVGKYVTTVPEPFISFYKKFSYLNKILNLNYD